MSLVLFVLTDGKTKQFPWTCPPGCKDAVCLSHPASTSRGCCCCVRAPLSQTTASPLRTCPKRAHKWTKASAVTPFAGTRLVEVLPGAYGSCSFFLNSALRQWTWSVFRVNVDLWCLFLQWARQGYTVLYWEVVYRTKHFRALCYSDCTHCFTRCLI